MCQSGAGFESQPGHRLALPVFFVFCFFFLLFACLSKRVGFIFLPPTSRNSPTARYVLAANRESVDVEIFRNHITLLKQVLH